MFQITFKLIRTFQDALNNVIDDNKYLREQLRKKDEEKRMIFNQIEDVIELKDYTETEKLFMIRSITTANKIELSKPQNRITLNKKFI